MMYCVAPLLRRNALCYIILRCSAPVDIVLYQPSLTSGPCGTTTVHGLANITSDVGQHLCVFSSAWWWGFTARRSQTNNCQKDNKVVEEKTKQTDGHQTASKTTQQDEHHTRHKAKQDSAAEVWDNHRCVQTTEEDKQHEEETGAEEQEEEEEGEYG